MENIISLTIATPIVASLMISFLNYLSSDILKKVWSKNIAMAASLITLFLTLLMLYKFDASKAGYQFTEHYQLASNIGLAYHMGLDGISIIFVVLTALLTPLCFVFKGSEKDENLAEYIIAFLLMDSIVIACFASVNLLLFYVFFEAMLVPMYIIIGLFGGKNKIYAALKFFLYTFLASIFFLIAIIYLYSKTGSYDISFLTDNANYVSRIMPHWVWIAIFVAMAVKVPMVPFHTWLPDAHVEAPTAGSVILAGILLKVGGYGMIRICLQILPDQTAYFAPYVIYLSSFAIIYASLVAFAQIDMKRMIAYSSVAHMGYVTAGIFSLNITGFEGAMMQMVSHGLISAGLFFVVGMLYERLRTKEIKAFGGVASKMPILASFFMILVMGSVGLPGTSGFIGEFLCLVGIFKYNIYMAGISALGIVLGAIYMLSLYKRTMLGEITNNKVQKISDLNISEILVLLTLSILIIILGIAPEYVLEIFRISARGIL